jgi:hypothetical protein
MNRGTGMIIRKVIRRVIGCVFRGHARLFPTRLRCVSDGRAATTARNSAATRCAPAAHGMRMRERTHTTHSARVSASAQDGTACGIATPAAARQRPDSQQRKNRQTRTFDAVVGGAAASDVSPRKVHRRRASRARNQLLSQARQVLRLTGKAVHEEEEMPRLRRRATPRC